MRPHDHAAQHRHEHAPAAFGRAFAVGVALNAALVALQFVCGVLGNSMALIADAGHNLTDVVGLLIAWGATTIAKWPPTSRYTYGLRSASILAAIANAIVLLIGVAVIAWEAGQRLVDPQPVSAILVVIAAAVGILVNGGTAASFRTGRADVNIRAAFLHMAADAAISFGVLLSGLAIAVTGWVWLDALVSLAICLIIVWGTWGLLRDAMSLALNAVPAGIDPAAVRAYLEHLPGVASIHDLHIWAMSTTETALTCHLVIPGEPPRDAVVFDIAKQLDERFGINHATLQIERGEAPCALLPEHVV
jgi:cobalt-zinc-cadmium efflux system protein